MGTEPRIRGLLEANLAIEAVLAPVITTWVGSWIDKKFGWSPWGIGIGAVFGISMALFLLRELIRQLNKDDRDDQKRDDS